MTCIAVGLFPCLASGDIGLATVVVYGEYWNRVMVGDASAGDGNDPDLLTIGDEGGVGVSVNLAVMLDCGPDIVMLVVVKVNLDAAVGDELTADGEGGGGSFPSFNEVRVRGDSGSGLPGSSAEPSPSLCCMIFWRTSRILSWRQDFVGKMSWCWPWNEAVAEAVEIKNQRQKC